MGIYDRDYSRASPAGSAVGRMRAWSITTWLIAINVAVFVLDILFGGRLKDWGYFSATSAIDHLQIWRFTTFQFLHAGIWHIFFNMLALFYFGPMIEGYLGSRRYLAFYLICGISGAGMYLLLMYGHILSVHPSDAMIGASAGILGVLIAAARVAPNTTVMLLFPPIPMKLRMMAWIFVAIAVVTIFQNGSNAGGEAGHLGGAAMGFVLIQWPHVLNVFDFRRLRRRRRGGSWKMDDWR